MTTAPPHVTLPPAPAQPLAPSFGGQPTLGALTILCGVLLFAEVGLLAAPTGLFVVTLVLLGYLAVRVRALRGQLDASVPWLASPVVVASAYSLGLAFGITNILYLLPGYRESLPASRALDYEWLLRAVTLAFVAASAMWVGFGSGLGAALGRALHRSRWLSRIVRTTFDVRWGVVWTCVGLSVAARVFMVSVGMYGVLGDDGTTAVTSRQVLIYLSSLGMLALTGVSFQSFSRPSSVGTRLVVIGLLLHEMAWGILAADKSDTTMPMVVVGLVYYLVRRRLPSRYVASSLAIILLSFTVLMPLRKMASEFDVRDIRAIAKGVGAVASAELLAGTPDEGTQAPLAFAVLQRLNGTNVVALGMRYKEANPDDPVPAMFAEITLLSPVYALVPLALWPDKPRSTSTGRWFYTSVLGGKSERTLAGPTIVGYLNFAGGLVAVVLGFFWVGVLQRGVQDRFLVNGGGGGLLLAAGMLQILGDLPAQYGAILAFPFRMLPLLFLAQFVLFRAAPRASP